MKKKFTTIAIVGLVALLGLSVSYSAIPAFQTWVDDHIIDKLTPGTSSEDPSSEVPSETPVFNIAEHGIHRFDAIGDKIVLVATVTPANATDKTIQWTSSVPGSVSVTALTSSSAELECLAAFSTSVTITARATNGTVDESDDFTATCVCSYYVAVESIDLQLWTAVSSTDPTYVSEITNYTDLAVNSGIYYRVKVIFTPSNATNQAITILRNENGMHSCGGSCPATLGGYSTTTFNGSFSFDSTSWSPTVVTEPGMYFHMFAQSVDNPSVTDSFDMTFGNHLESGDLAGTMVAFSNDNVTYMSSQTLAVWENNVTYETYTDVGVYVRITLPDLGAVVQGAYTVTANATYFTIVDDGDNDVSGGAVIIVQLAGATGATAQNVTISFTNYASQTVNVPFLIANAKVNVTGISLDNTTATF